MFAKDAASRGLGMQLIEVGDGHATMSMAVTKDMINGLGVCHGGLIFTLADSAMAFATNSPDRFSLAVNAEIDWVNPGRLGTTLTASATEQFRQGRSTICDAVVTDSDDTIVAHFRGRTRAVKGGHGGTTPSKPTQQ